ncbi:MAG: hypothetical protein JWN34_5530 [Bryobacterales bacterium]|nr:hypothetical protein [Bryobacterales bacterium]
MICPLLDKERHVRRGCDPEPDASEMDRMMKLQDVLLKAMAKKITWWATAEIFCKA